MCGDWGPHCGRHGIGVRRNQRSACTRAGTLDGSTRALGWDAPRGPELSRAGELRQRRRPKFLDHVSGYPGAGWSGWNHQSEWGDECDPLRSAQRPRDRCSICPCDRQRCRYHSLRTGDRGRRRPRAQAIVALPRGPARSLAPGPGSEDCA